MDASRVDSTALRALTTGYQRYLIWAQIAISYLFLQLAIWAPTPHLRNLWAAVAAITILALVLTDVLRNLRSNDHSSLKPLGLGLPTISGAALVLGIGLATVASIVLLVRWRAARFPPIPPGFRIFGRRGATRSGPCFRNSSCNLFSSSASKISMAARLPFGLRPRSLPPPTCPIPSSSQPR